MRLPVLLSDLWIQTKGDEDNPPRLVQFAPNPIQRQVLDDWCPDWRSDDYTIRGIREIDLKARQFGFSTLILMLYFLDTVNNPDRNTVVIADEASNTAELFKKVRIAYENLPEAKRPRTRYASKTELYFTDLRSSFTVLTAGQDNAGRSRTIHNLHCSEIPFWPNPGILTGLLQAVPAFGNIILESTANGEDEAFCPEYKKAEKGRSTFKPRFTPWFKHPEYRRTPPSDWCYTETEEDERGNQRPVPPTTEADYKLFGDELAIASRFNLTREQMYWRHQKIMEPGMGHLFGQEYPSTADEAFKVSGKTFFTEWDEDRNVITEAQFRARKPQPWWKWEGALDWGFGKPFCFHLGPMDPRGAICITDEVYGARILNRDQATRIIEVMEKRGLSKEEVNIYCDPSMWNVKTNPDGTSYRDIDDFIAAGLICIKAENRRTGNAGSAGWNNVRTYMTDEVVNPETGELYPMLTVIGENCPNTVLTIPQMVHDDKKPEDMDSDKEDHASDALRYRLNQHILKPLKPGEQRGYRSGMINLSTGETTGAVVAKVGATVVKPEAVTGDKWLDEDEGMSGDWTK